MTEAELAEGRRLCNAITADKVGPVFCANDEIAAVVKWLVAHATKLISAAADAEAIKREAVREFADEVDEVTRKAIDAWDQLQRKREAAACACLRAKLKELAAARGATLDEKP